MFWSSRGRSHRIHISKSTEQKLKQSGNYIIKYRGEISLKGRGKHMKILIKFSLNNFY
jgi:hypothetical protein